MLETKQLVKEVSGQEVILGFKGSQEQINALYLYFWNSGATNGELNLVSDHYGYCICNLNKLKRAIICRFESELEDDNGLYSYLKVPAKQRQSYLAQNRAKYNEIKQIIKKQAQEFADFWFNSIPSERQSFSKASGNFSTYSLAL
jgi:hypothetical protein